MSRSSGSGVILQPGGLRRRPLLFGEVLFDEFQDGTAVLGGAPFNVAWHLRGFGCDPLLVSRVGDDELGQRLRARMHAHGLDDGGITTDPDRPTGRVRVSLTDGQPVFSILPDQAYDFISPDDVERLDLDGCGLLYHGSLAARSEVSRLALERLRATGLPAFIDVNLRAPWWSRASVEALISGGRWLKINDAELTAITAAPARDAAALLDAADGLRARYGLQTVIVTRGARGALATTVDGRVVSEAVRVGEVADTVGAGDAFCAVVLVGILRGWSLATTLERAARFAAKVCARRGAVPEGDELYEGTVREWTN